MAKGAVLDESFISAIGLGEQLVTLSRPIGNQRHPVLDEQIFDLHVSEHPEIIYLERSYVFEHQVSIKPTYDKGTRLLIWLQRTVHRHPATKAPVPLLLARELFLLGDWREFQRFKMFVKSMRILDAQAREWLTNHHQELPELAATDAGLVRVLEHLGQVAEWPDLDGATNRANALEAVAKTFGKGLSVVRASPTLPKLLLAFAPDVRFNIFRLLSFVEDEKGGSQALIRFLANIAGASGDPELVRATRELKTARDLQEAFGRVRKFLFSVHTPAA
ncbi:MAG: hypothetical protein H0X38_18450 [Planctomycetes bacterium]|nr:hypothetical protein [Planctomycetota bacterium]